MEIIDFNLRNSATKLFLGMYENLICKNNNPMDL